MIGGQSCTGSDDDGVLILVVIELSMVNKKSNITQKKARRDLNVTAPLYPSTTTLIPPNAVNLSASNLRQYEYSSSFLSETAAAAVLPRTAIIIGVVVVVVILVLVYNKLDASTLNQQQSDSGHICAFPCSNNAATASSGSSSTNERTV